MNLIRDEAVKKNVKQIVNKSTVVERSGQYLKLTNQRSYTMYQQASLSS